MNIHRILSAAVLAGVVGGPACAAVIITVDTINLLPNLAGQTVNFFAQNTDLLTPVTINGLDFNLQVGDSGPSPGLGSQPGPIITAVDLVTSSPFAGNNTGSNDGGSVPQLAIYSTTTASGDAFLPANSQSRLASVTFSTVGFDSGDWVLALGGTLNGTTKYTVISGFDAVDVPASVVDGTLHISAVPEPETLGLATGVALMGFGAWRARRAKL